MTNQIDRLRLALVERYRIERELGSGGMATVYLAEDVKHHRNVAIKVLRPELSAVLGGERFLQEISVTATMQHPHVLPLFDSGEADGLLYYVMPYVEGESLADRIQRERHLPVEDAVRITAEVASALDYAHRRGVIHRDIKPANILLHDGAALVADFGIALAVTAAGGNRLTETGLSLGTPNYMSPEQAAGDREVDARSDIYALACVLYELLAGDPPHTGSTVQAIIAKVLTETPADVASERPTVPTHVGKAVHHALEKIPADRFATAAEFADALVNPHATYATSASGSTVTGGRFAEWRVLVGGAIAAFALGAVTWSVLRPAPSPESTIVRFSRRPSAPLYSDPSGILGVSPDGSHIAYVAIGDQGQQLVIHALDELEPRAVPGSAGAEEPVFSPDGEWVAFLDNVRLKKVPVAGGAPVTVADLFGNQRGATWGDNDMIVVAPAGTGGLLQVSAKGGTPDTLLWPSGDAGSTAYRWPEILPGGDRLLFTEGLDIEDMRVMGYEISSERITYLVEGSRPRYSNTGHLIYVTPSGALMAVSFDAERLEVTGSPFGVAEGIDLTGAGGAEYDISDNGTFVYIPSGADLSSLVMVDTLGTERSLLDETRNYAGVSFSPNGNQLAVAVQAAAASDIWLYDIQLNTLSRRTFGGTNLYPGWSLDGRSIIYSAEAGGMRGLWQVPADGSGPGSAIYEVGVTNPVFEGVWSPDGEWMIVRQTGQTTGRDIVGVQMGGDNEQRPLVDGDFNERSPALSPDGRWLAYASDESGRTEIYVQEFPGPGGKWLVSTEGGNEPRWSPDGRQLYYRTLSEFVAVKVEASPVFRALERRVFFRDQYLRQIQHKRYDVHPAGNQFVMVRGTSTGEIVVVMNWTQSLN